MKGLRVLGIILLILGIIGVLSTVFAGSALIVSLGVRALSGITVASYVVGGLGVLSLLTGSLVPAARMLKQRKQNRLLEQNEQIDKKDFSEYAKDSLNPEKTRVRFEQIRKHNPNLSNLVDQCLEQMDRMDTYQSRHESLIDANEAIYLNDTIEILDNSEKRMCRNFRNIINCCILIENTDGKQEDLDRDIVSSSLKDNEDELEAVSTLLKYSVQYINNYNRNGVSDRRELDAWIKVMKNSTGGVV